VKAAIKDVAQQDTPIGTLGILHPAVLEKFEIGFPCSALEFNLEPFTKEMQASFANEGAGKPLH
jgi:phenylalanyl-tRNA synthetase beta chain